MTTLPTRDQLTGIGKTYGQVRTALGDVRDYLSELAGNSGTNPQIKNADILNTASLGVRTSTPGSDLQVNGSMSVSATSAASPNPGLGSIWLESKLSFPDTTGVKLEFAAPSGQSLAIGRQPDILYYRTKQSGAHVFYSGGIHSDTAYAAGTGGNELLRLSDSEFKYKGQTIYHSGNGTFLRKDSADTASHRITFAAGLHSSSDVTVTSGINFDNNLVGTRLKFLNYTDSASMGIQGSSVFVRTPFHFAIYRNGTFVGNDAPSPGSGGETLLHVSPDSFAYRGQTIYHSGNSNFVTKHSSRSPGVMQLYEWNDAGGYLRVQHNAFGDNRFGLITVGGTGDVGETRVHHASVSDRSILRHDNGKKLAVEESGARPGPIRLYRADADEGSFIQTFYDGSRYFLEAKAAGGQTIETRVNRADVAGSVDYIHGHNIADGTVRFYELSRGQGAISGGGSYPFYDFAVHQFAFSSPRVLNLTGNPSHINIGHALSGDYRHWRFVDDGSNPRYSGEVTVWWDYITGSGDPYTWVIRDDQDNIVATWDAEDPPSREDPEMVPFNDPVAVDKPHPQAVRVFLPELKDLNIFMDNLDNVNLPKWANRKKFQGVDNPRKLFKRLLKDYASQRNLMSEYEEDMDLRAFIQDLKGDEQKKNWRKQAIFRVLSQVILGVELPNAASLISQRYKVSKAGKLQLK